MTTNSQPMPQGTNLKGEREGRRKSPRVGEYSTVGSGFVVTSLGKLCNEQGEGLQQQVLSRTPDQQATKEKWLFGDGSAWEAHAAVLFFCFFLLKPKSQ
jgi:hypothetical protein